MELRLSPETCTDQLRWTLLVRLTRYRSSDLMAQLQVRERESYVVGGSYVY